MEIISNYLNSTNTLWAIFVANVFLWLYVFYSQLESYLIYKSDGRNASASLLSDVEAAAPSDPGDLTQNKSLGSAEFIEETTSTEIIYSSRLPQIEKPDFFEGKKYLEFSLNMSELEERNKLDVINPPESYLKNPMPYLDSIIAKVKNDSETIILANLDSNDFGFYKPNIETFYDGVDVMTNFSRTNFVMKEDVFGLVESLKIKYDKIILLANPNESWVFKVLQEDAVSPKSTSIAI